MRLPRFVVQRLDRTARALERRLPPPPLVPVETALTRLADGALLVDVREEREWRAGTAAGARNIPLRGLRAALDSLPEQRRIVLVDEGSGRRSAAAARLLAAAGRPVEVLDGGLAAWVRAGHPVLPGR